MTRFSRLLASIVVLMSAHFAAAGGAPSPPGTGPFSIQLFVGKTQRVIVALDPPTTFASGAKIPEGTAFTFKLFRSSDGVKPYTAVPILAGDKGTTGKPYGAIAIDAPVDNEAPYLVYLGASVVINGVESPMTTNNLSFLYFPALTRYATPAAAVAAAKVPAPAGGPAAKRVPNPPGTGKFSVQAFTGATQRVALSLTPPKTFVDAVKIPDGTAYHFKIYRSPDGVKPYAPIPVVAGDKGTLGQPFGAIAIDVPVDNVAPYLVFLAASVVINGVESAIVTDNLTFGYFPDLIRYAKPGDALKGKGKDGAFNLAGDWTLMPGGFKMSIRINGGNFTGQITGPNPNADDSPITLSGTVTGQTYAFGWNYRPKKGEASQGTAQLTISRDGRSITGEAEYGGARQPVLIEIQGRTLRIDVKK